MNTDTTKSITAELLGAIHAESDIKRVANELFKAIIPESRGLDSTRSDAPKLCATYRLANPQFLGNIIVTVEAFFAMHKHCAATSRQNNKTQRTLRRRMSRLKREATAILRDIPKSQLGGHLVAIDPERNIFIALEVFNALHDLGSLEVGSAADLDDAVLQGFVIPLGEFWYDCRNEIPAGTFTLTADGLAPVVGSAAAFVVDALAGTSWEFSTEQVRRAFEAMQVNLAMRQAAGLLPGSGVDFEG